MNEQHPINPPPETAQPDSQIDWRSLCFEADRAWYYGRGYPEAMQKIREALRKDADTEAQSTASD